MLRGSCAVLNRLAIVCLALGAQLALAGSADLQRFLPQDCHHHGQFTQQKHLPALAQPLTSEGRFAFSCKAGLIWHSDNPLRETLVYPLKAKPWGLDAEGQRQGLDGPVHKQLGNLLNRLIGGDLAYLERHFHITGGETERLTLVPKAARMKRFVQSIQVVPNEQQVEILMTHSAEEATHIHILAQQSLPQLSAEACTQALPDLATACQGLLP